MAKRVKWVGNAADLPKDPSERHVRYVGTGEGGVTYQPYTTIKPETAEDAASGGGAQKANKKFDAGQYAGDAGKLFMNGMAGGIAGTGAFVEDQIGKVLDKLFPGAGFEGSGLFNVLYNGRPDWKWAGENGLVGIKQDTEYNMERIRENAERTDNKLLQKAAEFGGDIAYGLGNALPMAAEAAVTGGASAAAALTKDGLLKKGAEVVEKSGVLNTLGQAARKMLTSREYWTSFASEVGMDYYDALDNGATEDEALRYALSSAGLNSVIEIGGGIQRIPEKPTFKTWLKSAHEEGMEEIEQGIVSRLLENTVYDKGNPIASLTDENAVLNPVTALGEYAGGAAVGGILSGGQQLTQQGLNDARYRKAYGNNAQALVDKSLELNPDNALATKLQKKLDAGKKLTGRELRQLVEQNETDIVDGDRATIQSAVENRLTELGETENVPQMAEAIARQVAGEEITPAEKELLESSELARQVRQELNPENIRVGAADEAWTGQIGTARVNRAAYNRGIQENGVTGAKYNAETGKLDAIVTSPEGEVKTVPAEEANLTSVQEELFDWADGLENAGPVMVKLYDPKKNLELYARSFRLAYEYGKAGMPIDYVEKSEGVSSLDPVQRNMAYSEGQRAKQRQIQARQAQKQTGGAGVDSTGKKKGSVSLRGATVDGKTYAPVNRKTVDSRQWASVKAMRAFSRAAGVDVVFYQSQANEKGEYQGANGFYKDGKLYLDINAGRDTVDMTETAILKTAAHELTHFIQANSAQYEALKSFVVDKLTHEKGVSFEDLVTDKQRREPGLSYDEAVDEVVADACEMMLQDSAAVEQLAKENRSLAEKIRDWLREWVENLKTAMEGLTADRPESRAMMQYAQELQEIWDNALVDAARNGRGTVQENAPAEIKQQVRENFSNEIDSWEKDDMPEGVRFTLGSTGPVLQGLGAIESDIYMEGDKIKKILQDHPEMTLAEIKKVPQILEDPALILKSEGRGKSGSNSRLVCFGLMKAQNGQPVMTVMDLRPRENGFVVDDMQKVNSAYTKKNPMAFIQKSDVVYADKKRAIPLLRTTGLTISSQQLLRNGYVGSISYKGSSVNIEGVPFSSVVKMETNGKVQNSMRDSAGREPVETYIKKSTQKYGDVEKAAVERFGVTDDIRTGGYILRDGRMLDFSGAHWLEGQSQEDIARWKRQNNSRQVDHEDIFEAFEMAGEDFPSDSRKEFINRGNIRMSPEAPGINIAAEPTSEQYQVIRKIIRENPSGREGFYVDIEDRNRRIEKLTYDGNVSADRVINDIKYFYKNGEVRVQSDTMRFHQQFQQREHRLSDRVVLDMAAEMALRQQNKSWTPEDRNRLEIFTVRLRRLEEAQATLTALKEERKELLAGRKASEIKGEERTELTQNKNRIDIAKSKVERYEAAVWELESKEAIKTLLRKSREVVEKETAFKARQRYREQVEKRQSYQVLKKRLERTTNELKRMLLKPTKDRYAPEELVRSCLEVAMMLDESGPREGTKSKYRYETTSEALAYMKKQYDALENSEDQFYRLGYDKELSELVEQLKDALDGKAIRDLTYEEAGDVAAVLVSMQGILKEARYQIGRLERISTQELADGAVRQMLSAPERSKTEAATDAVARWSASVMRNIRRMCQYDDNAALYKLFRQLEEGVKKKDRFIMEASKIFDRFAGDRMRRSATELKTYHISGVDMNMTEMEVMQLILSAKRELSDKTRHLEGKGFIVPDLKLMRKGKGQDAISKGQELKKTFLKDILQLEDGLDAWAKDYMHTASEFFNGLARNAINEATVQTKHRRMAVTKDYVPYEVDKRTVVKDIDGVKFDATIEGDGMLKSVVAGAQNPLIIRGLNTIVENHIERVGRIYGLAVPIRNFNKAYNAKSQKGQGMSMKEAITRAWPAADTKLIEQAITDLQTSRERATDDISKLMRKTEGKFVEATLLSNISVTIKQAASYSTAGLYLSQKALFPYQATIAKLFAADNSAFAKKLFAEIDEHTPMHYMRRKGMSMEEAATVAKDNSKVVRWMDKKLPDVANPLKWIQNMDVATTAAIWLATKRQVELDGVKQSDPTYWNRVTELYEKVISETQPMYDSLHRPEVQKNTHEVLRGLMMFRTQPLQNAGILYDAAGEMAQARKSGNQEQIKASTRKFKMAVGSQVASLAVFATMTLLAYAVRNRLGRYRDDEEEVTVASVMKRVLGDMAVNGAQLIAPIGGNLVASGIESVINGSVFDTVLSIPTLEAINDWVGQMDRVRQDIVKLSEDEEADIVTDSVDFAMDTAGMLGIPAKNAFGILRGIVGNITDLTGHELSWATDKPDPSMAIAKACFENGHVEKGREVIDQVIQSKMDAGKDEKEARSAVRSSLTAYYKKLYLKAYKRKDNEEMKRIRLIIQGSRMYDDNAADVAAGWVKKWAEEEKKKEQAKKK